MERHDGTTQLDESKRCIPSEIRALRAKLQLAPAPRRRAPAPRSLPAPRRSTWRPAGIPRWPRLGAGREAPPLGRRRPLSGPAAAPWLSGAAAAGSGTSSGSCSGATGRRRRASETWCRPVQDEVILEAEISSSSPASSIKNQKDSSDVIFSILVTIKSSWRRNSPPPSQALPPPAERKRFHQMPYLASWSRPVFQPVEINLYLCSGNDVIA
ncbi:uncharacterized protein LOC129326440 [Eublepharis macularius]|uniref:Uncharacterized protein LOC129326440 n=1 Tax=Eublepharis macularius TaxID=481883 RepID=A0AA97J338_EUBMA|nr:uncharacterized protein LOC129326440 [Eublepharis macularius]